MILLSKYRSLSLPARAGAWYVACNILQKGIAFLVIPIYTRLLTPAEYGVYSVFQSWREILVIFATLNLFCGIYTKALVDYEDDRDRYTSSMQGLGTTTTVVVAMVYLIAPGFWNGVFEFDYVTSALLLVYFLVYPSFSFWSVRQRVEMRYRLMVAVTLAVSVATPAASIALLLATDWGASALVWGYLAVQIAVGLVFYVQILARGKVFFIGRYWLHGLKFNIPLIPHYLSLIVLGQVDRIMIQQVCGVAEAGIYTLAYQVSMVVNVVVSGINGSFVPWFYERLKLRDTASTRRVCNQLSALAAALCLGVMLLGPEIIAVFATEEYMEAIWVMPPVALSAYVMFVYGLFSSIEFYYDATWCVTIATSVGAIAKIVANHLLLPEYGFIVAGYTTLACYLVLMGMHWGFARWVVKGQSLDAFAIDERFVGGSVAVMLVVMGACVLLYSVTVVRFATILACVALALVFRSKIASAFKEMRKGGQAL